MKSQDAGGRSEMSGVAVPLKQGQKTKVSLLTSFYYGFYVVLYI